MSSILPTPSATPLNSSGPCSSFKTVIGVAGKLTDLDIHVRDKFSSSCRAKENLKYHVDFGDGQATYDQALQWAKGGFKGKTQHTYQESNIYNAKLIIDNETTLRRSCANVDVLIQRDPPKKCSELHIQSFGVESLDVFFDDSVNFHEVEAFGSVRHSEIEPRFSDTSIYFSDEYGGLEVLNSKETFSFINASMDSDWSIELSVKFQNIQNKNPLITNVNNKQEIGFSLSLDDGVINFGIYNGPSSRPLVELFLPYEFDTENWYHIAVIKKDLQVALYINGEKLMSSEINQSSYLLTNETSNNLYIGFSNANNIDTQLFSSALSNNLDVSTFSLPTSLEALGEASIEDLYPNGQIQDQSFNRIPLKISGSPSISEEGLHIPRGSWIEIQPKDENFIKFYNQEVDITFDFRMPTGWYDTGGYGTLSNPIISNGCLNSIGFGWSLVAYINDNAVERPKRTIQFMVFDGRGIQGAGVANPQPGPNGFWTFEEYAKHQIVYEDDQIDVVNEFHNVRISFTNRFVHLTIDDIYAGNIALEDSSLGDYPFLLGAAMSYDSLCSEVDSSTNVILRDFRITPPSISKDAENQIIENGNLFLQDIKISQNVNYDFDGFDSPNEILSPTCSAVVDTCPELHLQSDTFADDIKFRDLGQYNYEVTVDSGRPIHKTNQKPVGSSSMFFDGESKLKINNNFNFLSSGEEYWTLQFWLYPEEDVTTQEQYILSNSNGSRGINIVYRYNNVELWMYRGGDRVFSLRNNLLNGLVKKREWNHIAISFTPENYIIYINGSVAGIVKNDYDPDLDQADTNMLIGGNSQQEGFFTGYIQDLVLIKGNVLARNLPPDALWSTECATLIPEIICPSILIQSDHQDGSQNFKNKGLLRNIEIGGTAEHSDKESIFNTNSSIAFQFGDYIQIEQQAENEPIIKNGNFLEGLNFWDIKDTGDGNDAKLTDNGTVILYTNVLPNPDSVISQEVNLIAGKSYTLTVGIVNETEGLTGISLNGKLVRELRGQSQVDYLVTYTFTATKTKNVVAVTSRRDVGSYREVSFVQMVPTDGQYHPQARNRFISGKSNFTIESWYNTEDLNNGSINFYSQSSCGGSINYYLDCSEAEQSLNLVVRSGNANATIIQVKADIRIQENKWYHFTLSRVGELDYRFYVQAQEVPKSFELVRSNDIPLIYEPLIISARAVGSGGVSFTTYNSSDGTAGDLWLFGDVQYVEEVDGIRHPENKKFYDLNQYQTFFTLNPSAVGGSINQVVVDGNYSGALKSLKIQEEFSFGGWFYVNGSDDRNYKTFLMTGSIHSPGIYIGSFNSGPRKNDFFITIRYTVNRYTTAEQAFTYEANAFNDKEWFLLKVVKSGPNWSVFVNGRELSVVSRRGGPATDNPCAIVPPTNNVMIGRAQYQRHAGSKDEDGEMYFYATDVYFKNYIDNRVVSEDTKNNSVFLQDYNVNIGRGKFPGELDIDGIFDNSVCKICPKLLLQNEISEQAISRAVLSSTFRVSNNRGVVVGEWQNLLNSTDVYGVKGLYGTYAATAEIIFSAPFQGIDQINWVYKVTECCGGRTLSVRDYSNKQWITVIVDNNGGAVQRSVFSQPDSIPRYFDAVRMSYGGRSSGKQDFFNYELSFKKLGITQSWQQGEISESKEFEVIDLGQGLNIENNNVEPSIESALIAGQGGSFVFNGIDSYLSVNHSSLNIFQDQFTISFWFLSKPLNSVGFVDFKGYTILNYRDFKISIGTQVISNWDSETEYQSGNVVIYNEKYYKLIESGSKNEIPSSNPSTWQITELNLREFYIYLHENDVANPLIISENTYLVDTPIHIALTHKDGNVILYINGQMEASRVIEAGNWSSSSIQIGRLESSYFNGEIQDFRIIQDLEFFNSFGVPETLSEICLSAPKVPDCSYTLLLQSDIDDGLIYDKGGRNLDIFSLGNSTVSHTNSDVKVGNSSFLFDGASYLQTPHEKALPMYQDFTIETWFNFQDELAKTTDEEGNIIDEFAKTPILDSLGYKLYLKNEKTGSGTEVNNLYFEYSPLNETTKIISVLATKQDTQTFIVPRDGDYLLSYLSG